jgi:hypothetical protein
MSTKTRIDRLTTAALKIMTDAELGVVTLGKQSDYDEFTNEELLAIVHETASPELCQRFEAAGSPA